MKYMKKTTCSIDETNIIKLSLEDAISAIKNGELDKIAAEQGVTKQNLGIDPNKMYTLTCVDCGQTMETPFEPKPEGRQCVCGSCYKKRRKNK